MNDQKLKTEPVNAQPNFFYTIIRSKGLSSNELAKLLHIPLYLAFIIERILENLESYSSICADKFCSHLLKADLEYYKQGKSYESLMHHFIFSLLSENELLNSVDQDSAEYKLTHKARYMISHNDYLGYNDFSKLLHETMIQNRSKVNELDLLGSDDGHQTKIEYNLLQLVCWSMNWIRGDQSMRENPFIADSLVYPGLSHTRHKNFTQRLEKLNMHYEWLGAMLLKSFKNKH